MWLYKKTDQVITKIDQILEIAPQAIGFVYLIEVISTGQRYIVRKILYSTSKKPPLKGKARGRKVIKESDWLNYYGSSEEMKSLKSRLGPLGFNREILHFANSKSEMAYLEGKEIFAHDALIRPNYVNKWITTRINAGNLKGLFINDGGKTSTNL